VAQTFSHSTSGGRTAANEEGFGGTPIPYLRSVDDPYDSISPLHDWSVTLTDAQAAKRLKDVRLGDLLDLTVSARSASGRAATVDVVGADGTVQLPADRVRSLLGLRSTWFTITRP
jgi:stage II sporulation protein D